MGDILKLHGSRVERQNFTGPHAFWTWSCGRKKQTHGETIPLICLLSRYSLVADASCTFSNFLRYLLLGGAFPVSQVEPCYTGYLQPCSLTPLGPSRMYALITQCRANGLQVLPQDWTVESKEAGRWWAPTAKVKCLHCLVQGGFNKRTHRYLSQNNNI